jgi:hypothetical protein
VLRFFQSIDLLVWALMGLLILAAAFLASCGHYQPPGEDLWLIPS